MTVLASKNTILRKGLLCFLVEERFLHPWFRIHRKFRVPQDVCPVRTTPGDPGARVGVVMNGRMT